METRTKWNDKDAEIYNRLIDSVLVAEEKIIDDYRLKLDDSDRPIYDSCKRIQQLTMAVLDTFSDSEINDIRLFARKHAYVAIFHDFQNMLTVYLNITSRNLDWEAVKL